MHVPGFLTDRVLPSYAVVAGTAVMVDGSVDDQAVIWVVRGFITLCIALITFFIKNMYDSYKEETKRRDEKLLNLQAKYENLIKITAAHEVMYELWLENLASENLHPGDGERKTDQLHRIIERIALTKTEIK